MHKQLFMRRLIKCVARTDRRKTTDTDFVIISGQRQKFNFENFVFLQVFQWHIAIHSQVHDEEL